MRRQTLNPSIPAFRAWWRRRLGAALLALAMALGLATLAAPGALAAEIFSVRGPKLLQVGDQNRSYLVELACLEVREADGPRAILWLRQNGPRGTRVNLRPAGEHDGLLVAGVRVLKTGVDLGDGLVAEGLAAPLPCSDPQEGA
ncbi:MAG: hypothetical protein VKP70_06300 [Cyanobacteriota bacterium]|nr:hypothetical protein [Cyanobacteriota bacterium]